jgi:hypothetical protein
VFQPALTWIHSHDSSASETFAAQPKRKKGDSYTAAEWLQNRFQILDLLLKDFKIYNERARGAVLVNNLTDPNAINFACLVGKHSHLQQVKDRLDFLDQLLGTSPLVLNEAQVDAFWDVVVLGAITSEERDLAFNWLENARGAAGREHPFTDEVTQHLFLHKVPLLDLSQLSATGFNFFEYYFRYVNWKNDPLENCTGGSQPGRGQKCNHRVELYP